MAKKEDLMTSFGKRISEGSPKEQKALAGPIPVSVETISAQERERRSRTGRRKAGDNSPRATDVYAYTSLALDNDLYEKIREIARRNGLPYKDLVNAAMRKYIDLYEAKHGAIVVPRESNISADSLI